MSLPQLAKPYIIGPPTFRLLLTSCRCPSLYTVWQPTTPVWNSSFLGAFLLAATSLLDYPLQITSWLILSAPTLRSLLLKNHFVTGLYLSTPLSLFISILLHFLSQLLLSSHIDIYFSSSYWNRILCLLFTRKEIPWSSYLLVHCCIQVSRTKPSI